MSSTTSSNMPKGFSILQPTLGAPLSWMPAVGTPELEQLINAYLPGPASVQEKRGTISMDFFEYSASTGENFKYYSVNQAPTSAATPSFTTSPTMSDISYYGSPSQASTPAASSSRATHGSSSRKSAVKNERTDFSHLPGMKIMTSAGEDVTNQVSRGCKTKEQREHAHLMRVLKACDACKKKKIRCDPSHKRRAAPQAKVAKSEGTKPAKKARKTAAAPPSQQAAFTPAPEVGFDLDMMGDFSASSNQAWDEFLTFDTVNEPLAHNFYGAVPQDFDFFLGNENHFSPANSNSGSSGFTDSPALPLTPVGSNFMPQNDLAVFSNDSSLFLQAGGQEPMLPYMNDGTHGSNYVDFNLYSPSSSFIDEEPQKLKAGNKRRASAASANSASQHSADFVTADFNELRSSTGLDGGHEWFFDQNQSSTSVPNAPQWQVRGDLTYEPRVNASARPGEHYTPEIIPESFHGGDGDYSGVRASTTARPDHLPLQQPQQGLTRPSSTAHTPLLESHGRLEQSGRISPSDMARASLSRAASPQGLGRQDAMPANGGCPTLPQSITPQTICPTETQVLIPRSLPSSSRGSVASAPLPATAVPNAVISESPTQIIARHGEEGHSRSCSNVAAALAAGHPTVSPGELTVGRNAYNGLSGPLCQHGEPRTSEQTPAAGLPSPIKPILDLSPGEAPQRQLLHGKTTNAASKAMRLLATREDSVKLLSPVRQLLLCQRPFRTGVASQLVVFGLVSTLLIVVGFTPLLQQLLQTTSTSSSSSHDILAFFTNRTAALATAVIILPTLSPLSRKSGSEALYSSRSLLYGSSAPSPARRGFRAASAAARVPLACF